jgi:hypothetical protein
MTDDMEGANPRAHGRVAASRRHGDPADASADAALARATEATTARISERGVVLSGRETAEELVDLLDAIERFELTTERGGADLLIDEPLPGRRAPISPDHPAFVLPTRLEYEPATDFIKRIGDASARAERTHREASLEDRDR